MTNVSLNAENYSAPSATVVEVEQESNFCQSGVPGGGSESGTPGEDW